MYQALFADLESTSTTIITLTRRLSDYLTSASQAHLKERSIAAVTVTAADIVPLSDWLVRLWQDYSSTHSQAPSLLTASQEYFLWQRIIANSTAGSGLLNLSVTVQMAVQAWQLAQQWQLDLAAAEFQRTEDTATWCSWARTFSAQCAREHWLPSHALATELTRRLQAQAAHGAAKFPANVMPQLILVGFDTLNPQATALFEQLAQHGSAVRFFKPAAPSPHITNHPCQDTVTELEQMAHWAQRLRRFEPTKTIGCIIPNLNDLRSAVSRAFTAAMAPTSYLPDESTQLPFDLSPYTLFSQFPLVRTAFNLLGLYRAQPFSVISALLGSPHLGYAEQEMAARARLELTLRRANLTVLTARQLRVQALQQGCEHLAELLQAYLETVSVSSPPQLPAAWSEQFSAQLGALGWPGERALNSAEFQIVARWQSLLQEFAQLDRVLGKLSCAQALTHLLQLASNTLYQPQNVNTHLQFLTPLEAAGLPFDYLWCMGMQAEAWPPRIHANPFLPIALQRQHNLPHASSNQTLDFYRLLTQQLLQLAPQITVSYPCYNAERTLRVSALVAPYLKTAAPAGASTPLRAFDLYTPSIELESYQDDRAPPLSSAQVAIGGSAIFKYQGLCPFRAFAQLRCGAQKLPTLHLGLDARERGSLLHQVLEIIWRQLVDSVQLAQLTEEALHSLIQTAIETALLDFIKQRPRVFTARFTQLEKARLMTTLLAWLRLEKTRPAFTVHALEATYKAQFANLNLQLRIDRIDRTADGEYFIFDYKTGMASIQQWLGAQPDEPQLPLYTVITDLPIRGVAFALLSSKAVQYKGISAAPVALDGIKPISALKAQLDCEDWAALTDAWQRVLHALATAFTEGQAHCAPKKQAQTCRLCDLQILCRVAQQNLGA